MIEPKVAFGASEPWAFTQQPPLVTTDFCKEASERRIEIHDEDLRELWRVGILSPMAEIRTTSFVNHPLPLLTEPRAGSWLFELRQARDRGCLADAHELGFRSQFRWAGPAGDQSWWNGLIYSKWQLVSVALARKDICGRLPSDRLSKLGPSALEHWGELHKITELLVAVEARYLPTIHRGWIQLKNAETHEWRSFCDSSDPANAVRALGIDVERLPYWAEQFQRLARKERPWKDAWEDLMKFASSAMIKSLAGEALIWWDATTASEILLQCFEDVTGSTIRTGEASHRWETVAFQRYSQRHEPLDRALSRLGLSPHTGCALVVEGETEEYYFPLIRELLGSSDDQGFVRTVVLRGVTKDVTRLAAYAAAPAIEREETDGWAIRHPPTTVHIVLDPEGKYGDANGVQRQRERILAEIRQVILAQGVEVEQDSLDTLVSISTWIESCFEFEHFSDSELADGIMSGHGCDGLTREQLVTALKTARSNRRDIKNVWTNWRPSVSKLSLAKALWPVLKERIERSLEDGSGLPAYANEILDAYSLAARPNGVWSLPKVEVDSGETDR